MTWSRRARRARRRRLSEGVDQSERPEHPARRRRSGRGRLGESRRVVEQLVHAAHGGDVSRLHRQRVPLSRVRRPAGLRIGVRRQPIDGRRDHVPRLASGEHPGVRRRRAAIRRIRIWCSAASAPASRSTIAGPARRRWWGLTRRMRGTDYNRNVRTMPIRLVAGQSERAVLRVERRLEDDRPRAQLDAHQSRPRAADVGGSGDRGKYASTVTPCRSGEHHRAVAVAA